MFHEGGEVHKLHRCGKDTKDKQWAELVHHMEVRGGQTIVGIQQMNKFLVVGGAREICDKHYMSDESFLLSDDFEI